MSKGPYFRNGINMNKDLQFYLIYSTIFILLLAISGMLTFAVNQKFDRDRWEIIKDHTTVSP